MSKFFTEKPEHLNCDVEVSTVFMEHDHKILLLLRAKCSLSPNTWGVPGGKLEKGESPIEGLIREIQEELGLKATSTDLKHIRTVYVQHPKSEYQLHLFRWELEEKPKITLNPQEHHDYIWQPIEKILDISLLEGQFEALKYAYEKKYFNIF